GPRARWRQPPPPRSPPPRAGPRRASPAAASPSPPRWAATPERATRAPWASATSGRRSRGARGSPPRRAARLAERARAWARPRGGAATLPRPGRAVRGCRVRRPLRRCGSADGCSACRFLRRRSDCVSLRLAGWRGVRCTLRAEEEGGAKRERERERERDAARI
ncbi:hypothetical protein T484DRAFT_1886544, partial [Baffinella frigidus]